MTENEEVTVKECKKEVAELLTKHCRELAFIIASISNNERHLLDGIKLANDGIRSMATTIFVETQKAKENDE